MLRFRIKNAIYACGVYNNIMSSKISDAWSTVPFKKKRSNTDLTIEDSVPKRKRKRCISSGEKIEIQDSTNNNTQPLYSDLNDRGVECKEARNKKI